MVLFYIFWISFIRCWYTEIQWIFVYWFLSYNLTKLLVSEAFFLVDFVFLLRQTFELQIGSFISSFPIYMPFFYFFLSLLHLLEFAVWCWMRVVREDILAMFPIFSSSKMTIIFSSLLCNMVNYIDW